MSSISSCGVWAVATIALVISQPALSQTADTENTDDSRLETIVVTGTKRDTALIDSDLSVTVLDAAMIDQAMLRDFRRIDDLVPNVQFNELGQRGTIFVTVRGVESNPFIVNRAAVYIDGIPFRELSNSVLSQVESIEVLRGPQGTLYGANSESGLIIVKNKAPTEELTGSARFTASGFPSGRGLEADGIVSGRLNAGTLTGSLAFSIAREDAFVENLGTSTGETGYYDERFLHGRLRWTPTDRLSVNATAYWLDIDAPGVFDQQYMPLDRALYNQLYADFFNGSRQIDEWTALEDAPKRTTAEEIVAGLSADYALDSGTISFASSYREVEEDARGLDFDLTASPVVSGAETDREDYTNLELRFASPSEERVNYIVGVSYYRETDRNTKASFIGPGDLNAYRAAPEQEESGEDIGVFGSVNWNMTPKLRFGAGVRYERAERKTLQQAGELDLGFGSVVTYLDARLSRTFEEALPRVSVHYKLTDDFALHASAARGYIPGGFNLVAIQQGIVDDDIISYETETLWSREIGFKWRSADRRLRAAGAVFYITSDNWQDVQIATDESGRPVSTDFIGSDASIRSYGAEMELHWRISDAFSAHGHAGFVDAEYRDLQLDDSLNLRGRRIQFVPDYDGGLSLRYQWSSGVFFRAEANFAGKASLRSRGDAVQDAYETFGIQVGYERDRFSARLFGENLTNERLASGLAIENLAFGTDGLFYAPLGAPRKIGIEVTTSF